MNRAGLEPATYGLTCRTGFHQPSLICISILVAVWTLPSPCEQGATRQVSEEPLVNGFRPSLRFPADCPIRRIVTLSRTDGSKGVPAYGAVLPPAFRPGHSYLKSVALPTELPVHWCPSRLTHEGREQYTENCDFPDQTPTFIDFPANSNSVPRKNGQSQRSRKKTLPNNATIQHHRSLHRASSCCPHDSVS